jgi:hypothetical protein
MPADTIAPAAAAPSSRSRQPSRPPCTCCVGPEENWFEPGSCVLHHNTSALTEGDLARAQAVKALANSVCEEIAHE